MDSDIKYECFVFELMDPTKKTWARFKELQPKVNKISLSHGLKTKSVLFENDSFRSVVMISIPSEKSLTNAAIEVCALYSANNMTHHLLSRTGESIQGKGAAKDLINKMRTTINKPWSKGYRKAVKETK